MFCFIQDTQRCELVVGSGSFYQVAIMTMENILHHLYNIRVKVECKDQPFKSEKELPMTCCNHSTDLKCNLKVRLKQALEQDNPHYQSLDTLIQR